MVANGDINSPQKAKKVLAITNADAIMIGRSAQGQPWLFRQIDHFLKFNQKLASPPAAELCNIVLTHLQALYSFHGKINGAPIALKHCGWYLDKLSASEQFKPALFTVVDADAQFNVMRSYLQDAEIQMENVA